MTIRGETPPTIENQYPVLVRWIQRAEQLSDTARQTLKSEGVDLDQTVIIEGRSMRLSVILEGTQHHLQSEYPYMLRHPTTHTITGIYALNLNDQYWMQQVVESDLLPEASQQAVEAFATHLSKIPPSNQLREQT